MHLLPRDEGGWKAALQPRRVLYEFGTHALDLICQFFRAYPVAVTARIPKVRPDIDADVCVLMRLDFPEDRVADLVINRISHAPQKYIEMRLDCENASLRASLGGVARVELGWNSFRKRPTVRVSLATGGEVRWQSEGGSRLLMRQPRSALYHAAAMHLSQFLSSASAGVDPAVSARHAREVLRIVFAGYDSAASGGELVKLC
jgi:predicted dehydrogenase